MEEYDVIVVGGGPAGLTASISAAKTGASTLLLERQSLIAALKPCGEATSRYTFETVGLKPEPPFVLYKVDRALVYAPNLNFIEIKDVGYAIDKTSVLQGLAVKAAEAGAKIRVREEVKGVKRTEEGMLVLTDRGKYRAKVVIGADGVSSVVARSLGMDNRTALIPTVQYRLANCRLDFDDAVRFYLGNEVAPGGYAWIFPRGDGIVGVGIGVRKGAAKAYLDAFVKRFKRELGGEVIDFRGAPVPIGGLAKERIGDGVILIGDAAGTVIPLTGGGIHSSFSAGLVAGEVAGRASMEGDCSRSRLSEFDAKYEEPWGRRIRRSLRAMRAIEKLSDEELNMLQGLLDERDVLDLANGLDIIRVARKLLHHPRFAVKLARALLK